MFNQFEIAQFFTRPMPTIGGKFDEAIVDCLRTDGGWMKASLIASFVGIDSSNITKHLNRLLEAGIVERTGTRNSYQFRLKTEESTEESFEEDEEFI